MKKFSFITLIIFILTGCTGRKPADEQPDIIPIPYQADPEFQPTAIGGLTTLKKVYSFSPVPAELYGEKGCG